MISKKKYVDHGTMALAIVISGIAGRFPSSDNINQLRENLFNKVNLFRADHGRWKIGNVDLHLCLMKKNMQPLKNLYR